MLGFEYGIVQAPLGPDISGPELVAAVANAGGLGLLRAPDWEAPDYLRDLIRKTRSLTERPFGVGVVLAFPHNENIKTILSEKVAVLQVSWGEYSEELVLEAHSAGVKVVPQDGLISLLPMVVDLIGDRDIPIIAAGGIVDARGYVAALSLGAQGICLGTRFVASEESYAHPEYKRKLVEMDKTEYTDVFGRARWPGAPHRVLQTPFFSNWKNIPAHENEVNQPIIGRSTIHGIEKKIHRLAGTVPNVTTTGDIDSMVMFAGEGVGLIREILPAGEVVKQLVEGAQLLVHTKFSGL
ncbi:2-nitropropane dioxygenase-like protein [Citrus sinensis]|uniref:2-nitropropane dioxygenase-like protein n=1 Tax=Citrus sinensis TaxID=2711 RepID=A0ACB8ILW6_CITSI|nr:2-nitropropane dioxygenase-like protein [Citrus sinensis]